jgi:hypothetical protein
MIRDLHGLVHARVESVGLGMAERKSYIRPTENHITTTERGAGAF